MSVSGIAVMTGGTDRQIDHWVRSGHLRPVHDGGSGRPREWPNTEVRVARLMVRLTAAGFTPARAAQIARASLGSTGPVAIGAGLELTITQGG